MGNTAPNRQSLTRNVDMRIQMHDGTSLPMPCTLTYSIGDPLAVSATFRSAEGCVTWVFSRDLLIEGTQAPIGDGDIRVSPVHAVGRTLLRLELRSPAGEAVMEGPLTPIQEFLDASLDLLPQDQEWRYLNFDSGLAQLLNDDAF